MIIGVCEFFAGYDLTIEWICFIINLMTYEQPFI